MDSHEALLSNILSLTPVKKALFPDYPGSIKSLGAWGGDFILATAEEAPDAYFRNKGYETIIPYQKMVL